MSGATIVPRGETARRSVRSLVGAAVVTGVIAAAFAVLDRLPGIPARSYPAGLLLLAPLVTTVVLGLLASRRTSGVERGFWLAFALGMGALLIGEGCHVLWRLDVLPDGAWLLQAELGAYLVASLFAMVAMRRMVGENGGSGSDPLAHALDATVILLATFVVLLTVVLPTLRAEPALGYARSVVSTIFPSLAIAVAFYLLVFKRTRWRSSDVLIATWLVLLGTQHVVAASLPAPVRSAAPGSVAALLPDAGLVFVYCVAAAAAFERLRGYAHVSELEAAPQGLVWPTLAAPAVLIVLAPIIYLRLTLETWSQDDVWTIVWVGVLIGLATTGRSHLLAIENSSLRHRSTTDALTGLFNHRHFYERLDAEIARADRTDDPLSVVVMDVDDFDRVNNVYGHAAGDQRLRSIADRLVAAARSTDIICRVGGDEFAIIMPATDAVEAYKVCLRLQDHLHLEDDVCPLPVTLSMGIATLPEHAQTREELVQRADGALYWAKFHGREQIVIYDPGLVRSLGPDERIAHLEEESYLNMVQLLSSAVDARDPYTQRHSRRVAELAVALALEIGLDDAQVASIETAALLHDVGKIGVPDAILRDPFDQTPEAQEAVREHPVLATRILGAIPRREILPWIASHHERWDGTGYPEGLSAERIPFESRLITLCDAYDAMVSDRPYRAALSPDEARAEIAARAGTQFDPALTWTFVAVLESREAAARAARAEADAAEAEAAAEEDAPGEPGTSGR